MFIFNFGYVLALESYESYYVSMNICLYGNYGGQSDVVMLSPR